MGSDNVRLLLISIYDKNLFSALLTFDQSIIGKKRKMKKVIQNTQSRLISAIIAGFIGITISTILLEATSIFHIRAGGGGLFKLLLTLYGKVTTVPLIFYATWPPMLFRYLIGFSMVLIYVYLFDPLIPKLPGWLKGTIFSLFPWLLNGLIVLPMLGSKIFGYDQISPAGLIFFFFSNWTFGLLTGWGYERIIPVRRSLPDETD